MATRLRKTFHYPSSDSDSDDRNPDDELDSEQQEALIDDLRRKDEASITLWKSAFTALPVLVALLYVPSFLPGSKRRDVLISLLAVTNLLAAAYTIYFLPIVKPSEPRGGVAGRRQRALYANLDTPVAKYLPWIAGAIALLLATFGILFWSRDDVLSAIWSFVPGAVFTIVMVARHDLVPMDIDMLERLKYDYRGV